MATTVVELSQSASMSLNCVLLMEIDEGVIAGLEKIVDILKFRAEGTRVGVTLVGNCFYIACVRSKIAIIEARRQGHNKGAS